MAPSTPRTSFIIGFYKSWLIWELVHVLFRCRTCHTGIWLNMGCYTTCNIASIYGAVLGGSHHPCFKALPRVSIPRLCLFKAIIEAGWLKFLFYSLLSKLIWNKFENGNFSRKKVGNSRSSTHDLSAQSPNCQLLDHYNFLASGTSAPPWTSLDLRAYLKI